jgi:hypothetical protein
MAEQITVFKNVNNVTPATIEADLDINLLTTGATERAVIKDVVFKGGISCTLDLDGYVVATGTDMQLEGNLIMGPSSTLKVISLSEYKPFRFKGLFFSESTSGLQILNGTGLDDDITPTKLSSSNHTSTDACAAKLDGEIFFYRLNGTSIVKYNEVGSAVASWSYGSTGYCMTTDEEYIYRSGGSNQIYRTRLSDLTTDTLTTTGSYLPPGSNQGSYFLHYNGKLYSKQNGGIGYIDVIDLADLSVVRITDGSFNVGTYSDGAAVVTTLAGDSYIVEQGTSQWSYTNLATNEVTRVSGGSSSSTEYAQGGGEIAPGIALIFGEQSDRVSVIDMNDITRTTITSHGYTTDSTYGSKFAFAAYVDERFTDYTYNAFTSGVHITEDV